MKKAFLKSIIFFTLLLCVSNTALAAPSLQITAPPVVNNGWTGPAIDPTAAQGQWFVDESTREITEKRTHEFYDNIMDFGGGQNTNLAIEGYAANILTDPQTGNIIAFDINAKITNDTPATTPWADGSNSHEESLSTQQEYTGTLFIPILTAEFAIADLATLPNGFSNPYRQGPLPHIIATNEDVLGWYCYTPDSPPQGLSTAVGNYYVPGWKFADIPAGGVAIRTLQFTVDSPGLNPADPRYTAIMSGADLFANRTTSLKISTWIDNLLADSVMAYPEDPYRGSDVSVFHNGIAGEQFDYGDAPDQPYPTLIASNGAAHIIDYVTFMGNQVDAEMDGQPTPTADGDDLLDGNDDEDGVTFTSPLIPGQPATLAVFVSPSAVTPQLDAWIDYNADGVWSAAEQLTGGSIAMTSGASNTVNFTVPAGAKWGLTCARFRLSSVGGLQPDNPAGSAVPNGEVEDYLVHIEPNDPNAKYIQLPDLTTNGIDIRVDDADGVVRHLADDFYCDQTGPITDIHFWGSWEDDDKGQINSIVARFYTDDPVGSGGTEPDNTYSKPDIMVWEHQFYANDIFESLYHTLLQDNYEWWWDPYYGDLDPNGDQNVWKYDMYIDPEDAFVQEGTYDNPIIYWLELQVNVSYDPDANGFGWKTRDLRDGHFADDAVFVNSGLQPPYNWVELHYPQGHDYCPNSVDLAFMLTTGWEPEEKWEQLPDLGETGIDIDATDPFILADDFNCTETGAITEIVVWGSWQGEVEPNFLVAGAVEFTLSIHGDIPAGEMPEEYSRPDNTLWLKKFVPGEFSVGLEADGINEGWWTPDDPQYQFPGDHVCWRYTFNIDPNDAFIQRGTPNEPVVYWLDVQAKPLEPETKFGWKTSVDHWNDDAVWGNGPEPYIGPWIELVYPQPHPYYPNSIDLAFSIETSEPVEVADLGDAPDSTNSYINAPMTAYPYYGGTPASFPTVYQAGSPAYGPLHNMPRAAFYLGQAVSAEFEADIGPDADGLNNLDPPSDAADLDGVDDGLVAMPYMPRCRLVTFDYLVNVIDPTVPIYANVWFDFNRDGDWDDVPMCGSKPADEWAVQNQLLNFAASGIHQVTSTPFRTYDRAMDDIPLDMWMRITLSETPWMSSGSGGSGPAGGYLYGETEDYFFIPDNTCWSCADFDLSGQVNMLDLKELADNWLWTGTPGGYSEADLDCDGDIEFTDFATLASQWMQACP